MAVIKVKAKNESNIDKKPRVYFTCHPDDFEKHFKRVCDDIFKTHDCAVFYTEDMTEAFAEEDKEVDLGRNNLFVVPVTYKLLTTPNRAMDEDVPYALKEHIPVLPIMMEPGLDAYYSKPDKFGELQYLNPYSHDLTEISYEEKLRKHLDAVLISDEMAERVRKAFDAYIFLSYRKKDRRYANELMKLIHKNPELRDVAIWFDEFLTPGESFKENIEKMLDNSDLFTLLVTPRILEKVIDENGEERDNYVVSTELPMARKKKAEKGTEILPVEMEETDRESLKKIEVEDCVKSEEDEFRTRLLQSITKLATSKNNTPEHNFLIGLAYLDGIDVEVNKEYAVKLITSAAEAELPEAMEKLYGMYDRGNGITVDYQKALYWAKRIYEYYVKNYGEDDTDALVSLGNLAKSYYQAGDYKKSLELSERAYTVHCKILGEQDENTIVCLGNLAVSYAGVGEYKKSLELMKKTYELRCKVSGEEHPNTIGVLSNLATSYARIENHEKALELGERAYSLRCKIQGEEHLDTLNSLSNLAYFYTEVGEHKKALEFGERAYAFRRNILGEEHPDTLVSLGNLAIFYADIGDHQKSLELCKKAYDLGCKVLGKSHPNVSLDKYNLAMAYYWLKDYGMSIKMMEEVLVERVELFGANHEETRYAREGLSVFYDKMSWEYLKKGRLIKALKLEGCAVKTLLGKLPSE